MEFGEELVLGEAMDLQKERLVNWMIATWSAEALYTGIHVELFLPKVIISIGNTVAAKEVTAMICIKGPSIFTANES